MVILINSVCLTPPCPTPLHNYPLSLSPVSCLRLSNSLFSKTMTALVIPSGHKQLVPTVTMAFRIERGIRQGPDLLELSWGGPGEAHRSSPQGSPSASSQVPSSQKDSPVNARYITHTHTHTHTHTPHTLS
uniref:Uncharacterized protein n=1 Tax=Pipistrellus kuhlii TaxID=59472 RepID=A0A7J7WDX5_PIPKU|nr:hypothetical protein mPipKuh1_008053 [Pipistrellus kuhlii]